MSMNAGADTDIITNQPKEMVAAKKAEADRAKEEALLKQKTRYIGLTSSQAGQELIALVQAHLQKRVDELIAEDAKAQALVSILTDMGVKEVTAEKALRKLTTLQARQNEQE